MYIRLLDGSLPKFVTCTSEPAALAGVVARNVAAVRKPAAMTIAAPAPSSERNHRFIFDPFSVEMFRRPKPFELSKVSERFPFHCTTETARGQEDVLLQSASPGLASAVMKVSIEIRNYWA